MTTLMTTPRNVGILGCPTLQKVEPVFLQYSRTDEMTTLMTTPRNHGILGCPTLRKVEPVFLQYSCTAGPMR